ncbi:reverse transcriptase [Elysia marginata]|uniref:Reverse transcriptase n=1 Tax=Elysia marginata TaxID=1093978 RepID=A0AAV4FQA1_9GAST|nr:reverse transcriptase [Elysia marginata]
MELSRIARAMWSLAIKFNIQLNAQHLKGVLTVQADTLSRLSSQYEWCLHQRVYDYLNVLWGPHTLDRFASMTTTKCLKYNSRFLGPASAGIDALLQEDWGLDNNYVNAPIRLLDQVLDIVFHQKATATVKGSVVLLEIITTNSGSANKITQRQTILHPKLQNH